MYYVYVYLDPRVNGNYIYDELIFYNEPIYVGKGKNDRDIIHLENCKNNKRGQYPFYDKLNKILSTGYIPVILRLESFDNEILALEYEKFVIEKIGRLALGTGFLLNLTAGGIGGDTYTGQSDQRKNEISSKRSISNKGKNLGKKCSEKQKEKLRVANLGKKASDETKQKMSISRLGKSINQNTSEESKLRRSNAHKGKKVSDETKLRIKLANKGMIQPELICPVCNKKGKSNAMKRWHFNNCKHV